MANRIQQHKEKLTAAREKLNQVFDSVGDRWEEQLYSDGAQWTIQQLAIHLMISDAGHNKMAMGIAQGQEVIPADYDLQRFNKRSVEKRAEMTIEAIREAMKQSRAEMMAWLDTIDEATLDIKGRHATMQILTISEILDVLANHELGHASDIEKHLQG